MKLEYPMNDSLPNIENSRDRFLAKLFDYRKQVCAQEVRPTDEDYELLYTYGEFNLRLSVIWLTLTHCRLGNGANRHRDRGRK